jgi:hypothetical protein
VKRQEKKNRCMGKGGGYIDEKNKKKNGAIQKEKRGKEKK